jgi:hypothetical protein
MNIVKVYIQHKVWKDNDETGRRAGQGILVTSRQSSSIKLGNLQLKVSSPSITIAGATTKNASNEISFWLEELSSFEEYQTLPDEYRGEQGCYLKFTGDVSDMQSKEFITTAEHGQIPESERIPLFAA